MSEFNYVRRSGANVVYGENTESNTAYVARRSDDANHLIRLLFESLTTYDWKTIAGSNLCTKMELGYVTVTENRFHDYLPTYCMTWTDGNHETHSLYADDFLDIVSEILRRWW